MSTIKSKKSLRKSVVIILVFALSLAFFTAMMATIEWIIQPGIYEKESWLKLWVTFTVGSFVLLGLLLAVVIVIASPFCMTALLLYIAERITNRKKP